jgi:CARDB
VKGARHLWVALAAACGGSSREPTAPPSPGEPPSGDGGEADLSALPIQAPAEAELGRLIEMHVGVRNGGGTGAGPGWVIRGYLSRDPLIDSLDTVLDQFTATREPPARAEDSYLRHRKVNVDLEPGLYYLGSILDVTGVVPESVESNNALTAPRMIRLLPNGAGVRGW